MLSVENRRKSEVWFFMSLKGPAQILQVHDIPTQFGLAKLAFISRCCPVFSITIQLSEQFSTPHGAGVLPQNSPNHI